MGDIPTLLTFPSLVDIGGIQHGITTRWHGVRRGDSSSLNLSYNTGDLPDRIFQNRVKVATSFEVDESKLIIPDQQHTSNVAIVAHDTHKNKLIGVDALVTNCAGIVIGVLAADCVPLIILDRKRKVVAAVHAGWRGTVQDICGKTIRLMKDHFGCKPTDIHVGIGPSISQVNYQVGKEVLDEVTSMDVNASAYIDVPSVDGKANLDLWKLNRDLLQKEGVLLKNIEIAGRCTYNENSLWFSARKEGFNTGRFGVFILI